MIIKVFKFFALFLLSALPHLAYALKVPYKEAFLPEAPHIDHPHNVDFFQSLYLAYDEDTSTSQEYLIPKLIHFVWLGSKLPIECREMIRTWKKMHPTWKIKIWTDADAEIFGLRNLDAFNKAINFGEKSDIFRYEILYRFGGVYADIDFECVQPFDTIHKSCEFYTGIGSDNCLLNGLIGARPKHPILKACIEKLRIGNGDHDENRIMNDTGPYHFTRIFLACSSLGDAGKVVPFPPTFFYPFPAKFRNMTDKEEIKRLYLKPESMTVHYWSSTWQRNKL